MNSRLRRLLASLPMIVAVALLGACGGHDDGAPEALPATDAPVFVHGDFGDIPIHPLAEPVGSKSTKDDVTAQSFQTRNLSREQLFEWYATHLDGWTPEREPEALGASEQSSWRATWTNGDSRLIVTVSAGSTLDQETASAEQLPLQYSLSLEPAERALPSANGAS